MSYHVIFYYIILLCLPLYYLILYVVLILSISKVLIMRMISCFFLFLLVCFGCGDESSNQDEIVKDSVEDEIVVETEPE